MTKKRRKLLIRFAVVLMIYCISWNQRT